MYTITSVTVDNMHSVSSNAVAVSKSYSTTEQKTGGVWLDGKPIYRKVYTGSVSNGSTIPLNISNLERVVRLDGYFWYANNEVLQFNNPNDNGYWSRMHISSGSFIYFLLYGFGTVNAQVYVEYTKTTD